MFTFLKRYVIIKIKDLALRRQRRGKMKKYNRIARGSGVYPCVYCGKQTRETGEGESDCKLCAHCYLIAGLENQHSDDGHNGDFADCPLCNPPKKRQSINFHKKGN